MQEKIKSLIQRHEIFKLKGLQLNESDLFDWIILWEEMADCITELRSTFQETKQENDKQKGLRMIELKAELDGRKREEKIHRKHGGGGSETRVLCKRCGVECLEDADRAFAK